MTQLLERLGSKVTSMVLPEEEAFACIPPEYWSECDLVYNFAQHVYYYESLPLPHELQRQRRLFVRGLLLGNDNGGPEPRVRGHPRSPPDRIRRCTPSRSGVGSCWPASI